MVPAGQVGASAALGLRCGGIGANRRTAQALRPRALRLPFSRKLTLERARFAGNDRCATHVCMASITIRDLDDETTARLRIRAARHQRSIEEEARTVLCQALAVPDAPAISLAAAIQRRFRALGGVEVELPSRDPIREPRKPFK